MRRSFTVGSTSLSFKREKGERKRKRGGRGEKLRKKLLRASSAIPTSTHANRMS
jgi:hypothetical protein